MSRLIDADETIIRFGFEYDDIPPTTDEFAEFINRQPTVDAEPIKHGEWIYLYESSDINRCSLCGFCVQDKISNVREMFNYCPNCGAKMGGEVKTE